MNSTTAGWTRHEGRRKHRDGTRRRPINHNLALIVSAALDRKAVAPVVLDLRHVGSITDYFVICHGRSSRQVQAIADRIEEVLKKAGTRPNHLEGYPPGEWILLDYVDIVVHIFHQDKRNLYSLEKLWGDAPRLEVAPVPIPPVGGGAGEERPEGGPIL